MRNGLITILLTLLVVSIVPVANDGTDRWRASMQLEIEELVESHNKFMAAEEALMSIEEALMSMSNRGGG